VTEPLTTLADSAGNVIEVWAEYDTMQYRYHGFVAKRSRATGELLWGPESVSPTLLSRPVAALLDARDDLIVTGWAQEGTAIDWSTVKFDGATGAVAWGPVRYDAGDTEMPAALALDSEGNAIVLGQISAPNVSTWALVKYDASSGGVRWGPVVFQTPVVDQSFWESFGRLVSTDAAGNVFVAAQVRTQSGQYQWGTLKYDGATGGLLWGPVYFDSQYSGGYPTALAVDSNGDAVVTGLAPGESSNWATFKYSGRNGSVLWGPIAKNGDYGEPARIRVDRANDVIVTGRDFHGQDDQRWATVKYAGATGQLRWGPVVTEPSLFTEGQVLLSLDASGNPIVVSPSHNGIDTDWTVVKYSGDSGGTVWGPMRYDAGDNEIPAALSAAGADFVVTGSQHSTTLTVRYTEGLAVETLPRDVDHGSCGDGYAFALEARNGTPPYAWSVAGGALPPGLSIDSSGQIAGEPLAEGSFSVTVRVTDAAGASADRLLTIDVSEGGERPRIAVTPAAICPSGYSLALDRTFSSYSWLPDGQTSPTIPVCPEEPSLYGVTATDTRGCAHRASVELAPAPTPNRQPIVPPSRRRPPVAPHSR
jgi:hypothetical protein